MLPQLRELQMGFFVILKEGIFILKRYHSRNLSFPNHQNPAKFLYCWELEMKISRAITDSGIFLDKRTEGWV